MENGDIDKSGKRIRRGIIILILSAVLIVFQFKYFIPWIYNPDVALLLREAVQNAGFSISWAFFLGLIFGLIICPFCALPLASYASNTEKGSIGVFRASILFNAGRFFIFIIIGVITGIASTSFTLNPAVISYAYVLSGIMMLFLAADLFGLIEIRRFMTAKAMKIINEIFLKLSPAGLTFKVNHPLEYTAWGLVLGVACGIEFLLPVMIIWANALSFGSIPYAVLIFAVFGIATFIQPTILITGIGGSVDLAQKHISGVQYYARYTGAVFLLFLGFVYVMFGITSGGTLLSQVITP